MRALRAHALFPALVPYRQRRGLWAIAWHYNTLYVFRSDRTPLYRAHVHEMATAMFSVSTVTMPVAS